MAKKSTSLRACRNTVNGEVFNLSRIISNALEHPYGMRQHFKIPDRPLCWSRIIQIQISLDTYICY